MRVQPLALRYHSSEAVTYTPETSCGIRLKLLSQEFAEIKTFLIYFLLCCVSLFLTIFFWEHFLAHKPSLQGLLLGTPTKIIGQILLSKDSMILKNWIQQHNIVIFCNRLKALCSLKISRSHSLFWCFILFFIEPGSKVYTKSAKLVNKWKV